MLAVAFVGPVGAFVVAVAAELGAWVDPALPARRAAGQPRRRGRAEPARRHRVLRARRRPAGRQRRATSPRSALVGVGFLALNFALLRSLAVLVDGGRLREALHHPRELLPSLALTVALTLAIAGVSARFDIAASLFVVLIIVAFNYMSRLVVIARQRAGPVRGAVVGRAVGARALARSPRRPHRAPQRRRRRVRARHRARVRA